LAKEDIKAKLRSIGAEVGGELPTDVRAAMDDVKAEGERAQTQRVGVEIKRLAKEQVFIYEDDYLKLVFPNVRLDIYLAFAEELSTLAESKGNQDFADRVARAFWLLHYRPGLFRRWRTPNINNKKARDFLAQKIPQANLIFNSLINALFAYHGWVVEPKKKVNEADIAAPPKPSPE